MSSSRAKGLRQASTASLHICPIRYLLLSNHSMLFNPIYWQHREIKSKLEEQVDRKMRSYKKYGVEFKLLRCTIPPLCV